MERWQVAELFAELAADADRKVIFVEGTSDLSLWRSILPPSERGNVTIYPAELVELHAHGGMRGRLLALARQAQDAGLEARIRFFVDADYDRALGRAHLPAVILTDGRDLQSYLILEDAFWIFCIGRQDEEQATARLREFVLSQGRSIAIIRLCSETRAWQLPFQRTLAKGVSRFLADRRLDSARLLRTLVQNSPLGLAMLSECEAAVEEAHVQFETMPDYEVVHGHDLARLIAEQLELAPENLDLIVLMGLERLAPAIAKRPNVSALIRWAAT